MARPGWVSDAWRPIVLHNFAYAMHKKTGGAPSHPNVPPLVPCKNRSFQHRGPRRRCRESWTPRDWRRFGARRDAKRAVSPRRTPSANPNRLPKDPAGSKRRFRRVCSHPGLLKTPKNARRAPGDPCAPRKTRPHPKECERESRMAARAPGSGRNPWRVRPGTAAAARQQKTSCPALMSAPAYANLQLGR